MGETKTQSRQRRIARFRERIQARHSTIGELSLAVAIAKKRLDDAFQAQMFDQSMIDSLEDEQANADARHKRKSGGS